MNVFAFRSSWKMFRWYFAGVMLCMAGTVTAQGVESTVEPPIPVARFVDRDASAVLHLINRNAEAIVARLEVRPLQLKGGTGLAQVRVLTADGKTTLTQVEMPAAVSGRPGTVDLHIDVNGMDAPGTYEGWINILPASISVPKLKVDLSFIRLAPTFDPIVRGTGIVNGLLTFKPQSSNDKVAWVTVENPKGAADIEVLVTAPAGLSGKGKPTAIEIEPAGSFRLAPGSVQPVSLRLTKVVAGDALFGKLLVSDAAGSGTRKELDLLIQPGFTSTCNVVYIVILVISGTLLSVLVCTIVPTLISRQNAWRRLSALTGSIEAATARGSSAQLALKAQLHHIDFLAHNVWWFSTRAMDTLVQISAQSEQLEARIKLVSQAQDLRAQARMYDTVPVSTVPSIDRRLDAAVKSAVVGMPADAQKMLDEISAQFKDAALLTNVQTSLNARIAALSAASTLNANGTMIARLASLQAQSASLNAAVPTEMLLNMDRECFSAHIYFVRYLANVIGSRPDDEKFRAMESEILDGLNRGVPGMWRANDLVQSLELGVLSSDLDAACADEKAAIVATPSEARINELIEFAFVFDDPLLNESPLTKRLAVKWTFDDDGSASVTGSRCLHFYKASRDTYWGRKDATRTVKANVNGKEFKFTLQVRGLQSGDSIIARAEVLSTLVVFGGAVALALITHQGDIKSFENLSDYINPFLWGFGLDQMKNLVAKR